MTLDPSGRHITQHNSNICAVCSLIKVSTAPESFLDIIFGHHMPTTRPHELPSGVCSLECRGCCLTKRGTVRRENYSSQNPPRQASWLQGLDSAHLELRGAVFR